MDHKGFIGSFAISALLVSAAVALLLVMGALLAFDGFPGPGIDDSTKLTRVVGADRAKPQLVLEPPTASELDPGSETATASTLSGSAAALSTLGATDASTTPDAPGTSFAAPETTPTAPTTGGTPPEDPTGGDGDGGGSTGTLDPVLEPLAPVTDGIEDALGRTTRGLGLSP